MAYSFLFTINRLCAMKNRQAINRLLTFVVILFFAMPVPQIVLAQYEEVTDASAKVMTSDITATEQISNAEIAAETATAEPLHPDQNAAQIDGAGSPSPWFVTSENADSRRLLSQTKLLFGAGLVTAGVLYCMPESVTNWDRDDGIEDLPDRWWKNVSRGPAWDNDDWFINYVGHTYCGGVYYMMARKSGYNQWDSFVYTTLMSTFFWEYGIEAFAERPSIQDLFVTPLGGWLYGEWAYRCEQKIEENDNRVLGSKTIGGISLFLLDPIDHLSQGVNRLLGREWVLTGRVTLRQQTYDDQLGGAVAMHGNVTPGLRMAMKRTF